MEKKQISKNGIFKQTELIQFDDTAVYIGRDKKQRTVKLENILSLSKTAISVNNRYYWQLVFRDNGSRESIEFRPNNTLWNRNFPQFHALLSEIKPEAIKTPYRWWDF